MTGRQWRRVMELALARHADTPSVDDVVTIIRELYPAKWTGHAAGMVGFYARLELAETMRRVAFIRDGAVLCGLDPSLPIAELRNIAGRHYLAPEEITDERCQPGRAGHCPLSATAST